MVLGLVLLLAALGWTLWNKYHPDPAAANKSLIAEVSERALVPPNETPTISTVLDKNKVNQPFLANAEDGDKVLLYFLADRAIVYRPSTKKIVNMGPLQDPSPIVFLRNGAPGDKLPAVSEKIVQSQEFIVGSRDIAVRRSYTKTLVIDVAGNRPDIAEKLATLLGASVGALPADETRPDADLLVIVGSDAK